MTSPGTVDEGWPLPCAERVRPNQPRPKSDSPVDHPFTYRTRFALRAIKTLSRMTAPEQTQLTEGPAWGRLLLVVPDHWTRVLLRAELLEEGYEAVGATSMEAALSVPKADTRGPVRLILLDQDALSGQHASA